MSQQANIAKYVNSSLPKHQ